MKCITDNKKKCTCNKIQCDNYDPYGEEEQY